MEPKEQEILKFLEDLGVSYDYYPHEAVYTIAAANEIEEKIGFSLCKNLFLSSRHETEFFLYSLPGHKKLNTGKLSKQLSVPRMTFAKEEKLLDFLNLTPGSVTPLGLFYDNKNQVKFLFDIDLLKEEKIALHPMVNTATITFKTEDFLNKFLPSVNHRYEIIETEVNPL